MTRVLLVDDDPESLYLLRALLQGRGWEVEEARHGAEALAKARVRPPDAVITDLLMPVMDGYTLLRHWKTDHQLKRIPFIVCTATYAEPQDKKLALDLGADAFISKPTEAEVFLARLDEVCERSRRGELSSPRQLEAEESTTLERYTEIISRKLDEERLELERTNRELAKREARLRAIFDTEPECVMLLGEHGTILEMNPAGVRMIEADSLHQATQARFELLVTEDHRTAFRRLTEKVFRGESGTLEFQVTGLKGGRRWLETHATPLRGEQGQVTAMLSITRDITERRQAEAALRASEERFRELAETIEDVFWISDPARRQVFYVSPAYEKVWGRSCQSFFEAPHTGLESIHPEDADRVVRVATARETEGAYDEEYRIVRPDGQVRWVRDRAFPVRNAAGQLERIVGVARDVTERRTAQAELERREEHFRLLIENASDLITVINNQGVIRYQSPAARRVLGYAPEELIGRSAFEFIHPQDATPAAAAIQRAMTDPSAPVTVEYRFRHKNGQWRTLQSVGRDIPAHAPDGFLVVNSRDVTETRQLEEQFRQAQKMEAIGQLAGGVAHDFNNMLAVITGYANLLLERATLEADAADYLKQVSAAAERASSLTRQLLLFSRRQIMQPRDLDLNEVVKNLSRMLQRIIGEDVRLQLRLHPAPLVTHADAGMLDQVLMNLAVNARDAMPDGGLLVIETAERTVDDQFARQQPDATPGRYVCLSVSDTGTGIPPEVLPRIFEPFFTTKEPGKGTGLGLATVFGIVKQHQGWLAVTSPPGRGATFQICLPARSHTGDTAARAATQVRPRGGSETILVVEDEPAVRGMMRAVLQSHGYQVLEAASGLEALNLWQHHQQAVALLLIDLVMPSGLSGQELARRLQADRPQLKVIFVSGYSTETAGRDLHLRTGENFVPKPFAPDQLLEPVRRALDG
jgi:PAS domain S-box-containing protein